MGINNTGDLLRQPDKILWVVTRIGLAIHPGGVVTLLPGRFTLQKLEPNPAVWARLAQVVK